MSTTRILLVRHGATKLGAEDRFAGSIDVELSDEGRAQVRALARRLAHEPIDVVWTSPLGRSVETAAILAEPHGRTPEARDGLREIDHGRWEGLVRAEVEERYPEEYAAWEADPFTFAPVGGETGLSVMARALPVVREAVVSHPGRRILLVSHKATIRLVLASLLGFDPRGYRDRLDQLPASLNVLDFKDPARARLVLFNDVSHYVIEPEVTGPRLSKWFRESEEKS